MTLNFKNKFSIQPTASGGGSATLITKNIIANGIYNASGDNADGYSSVDVDVPPTKYELPSDAVTSSSGYNFSDGVLTTTPTESNKTGGIAFPINVQLQSGDTLTLKFKTILEEAGTNYTDKGIFRIGQSATDVDGDVVIFDTWSGPRLLYGSIVSGTYTEGGATNSPSLSQPPVGLIYFKLDITQTSITLSSSTDNVAYTPLRSVSYTFSNGGKFNYLIIGHVSSALVTNTYDQRQSVLLPDCELTLNGTKVRDFVTPVNTLAQKTITVNGTYNASSDSVDGYNQVIVNVTDHNLAAKNITENGTYYAYNDGVDGYSQVNVNVPGGTSYISANITKVGQVYDTNGVISNFSTSIYGILPITLSQSGTCEQVFKIKTGSLQSGTYQRITGSENGYQYKTGLEILIYGSKLALWISSNGTGYDVADGVLSANILSANTDYYLKCIFDGSNYVLSYSTDGETYTAAITVSSQNHFYSARPLTLGCGLNNSPFLGSIDLTECYIKENNVIVWEGVTTNS